MDQFYDLTILLHIGTVYLALVMAGINFLVLKKENPKRTYLALLPLYYTILASLAFTGLVMINFFTNFAPFIMAIAWIYILVTTIKTYKKAKKEPKLTPYSIKKMQIKYLIDIAIYIIFIIYGRY